MTSCQYYSQKKKNAKVTVQTSLGLSKKVNISNIVIQGTKWGSLMCTTTMDKLEQLAYENADLLYMYKGLVAVPPICMVDDVLSLQKCSESRKINAFIICQRLCHLIYVQTSLIQSLFQ